VTFVGKHRVRLIHSCFLTVLTAFSIAKAESPAKDEKAQPVILSGAAIRGAARFHVEPEYPATARQFGMSGEVVAEVTVGLDGKVENIRVMKGTPILNNAVISALKKWTFAPFNVDGHPTRVKSTLSFDFKL